MERDADCLLAAVRQLMRPAFLAAALLALGLAACGEKSPPPAPPPAPAPTTSAPTPPAPAAAVTPTPPPAPGTTAAPALQLQAGVHYDQLRSPQPTETGNKIELVEFFWYACPHCNSLQAPLREWLKRKPADVELRRIPAVLQDSWLQLARAYYTFDAMGLVEKLHYDLFAAIHDQHSLDPRALASDPKPLFDWVAAKGVDRQKFVDTYNSFAVTSRTQRATDLSRNYDVPYTPVLVVNGRYGISPSMKGNGTPDGRVDYDRFFRVLDQLIVQSRGKDGGGK